MDDLSQRSEGFSKKMPPWNVPYAQNPLLTGREEILTRLRAQLQVEHISALSQPLAISGLGGIGKTQIAVEYAHRFQQEYREGILWTYAESQETLFSSFVALATLLDLPERDARDQTTTVQAVKTWLRNHRDWLLILDNADEVSLIASFLPPLLPGHVILTTRATALGQSIGRIEIDTLSPESGAYFVLRRAKLLTPDADIEQALPEDRELALFLTQTLGGLPLALDQAGAYIEETGCGLADYLRHFEHHRAALLKRRGEMALDHSKPVATTWSLSFEQVQKRSPIAVDLLRMCAFLAPDAIPLELLLQSVTHQEEVHEQIAADTFLLEPAIEILRAYSLLQRDPKTNTLSIHRLVQAVLQDSMTPQEKERWQGRVIRLLNATFPEVTHKAWKQCERLISHVQLCVANTPDSVKMQELADILRKAANYLREHAQYKEAEPLYQRALRICEQALGPDHPEITYPLYGLAKLSLAQGKYEDAEPLYQKVSHIRKRAWGPEHPETANPLNGLASLYLAQGKYRKAELLYRQALHIREQALGPNHKDVASSLQGLATLYKAQGKYKKAESLYQQALHIREQALESDHPAVASSLRDLANLYVEQKNYKEAEPLYQRALYIRQNMLGSNYPDVNSLLQNLANLYMNQERYEEAKPLYKRALDSWMQILGPNDPHVSYSLNGLATLYAKQGKYEQAEPLYQRALHILEHALGSNHPDVASPLNNLAILYTQQGCYEQAELCYQRVLQICKQALGPNHPDTASSLHSLAILYTGQGKYEQAEPLYQQARLIWERISGHYHPDVAYVLNNLAILYKVQGKYEQAKQLYQEAVHILEQALGPNHSDVTNVLNNLAILDEERGQYGQAEPENSSMQTGTDESHGDKTSSTTA